MALRVSGWQTVTIDAAASLSTEADLGELYRYVQVLMPTMDGDTNEIHISRTSGGTYYKVQKADGGGELQIRDAESIVVDVGSARFVKINGSTETSARTIYLRGIK